jgi:hypothetical protein
LLLIHKFSLMPPRLSSQTFLGQLLSQASDTQALCTFFRAYEQVRKVLAPAQYKFEELALEWSCNAPSFDVPKLPQDALDAFAKARAADRSEHPG